MVNHGILYPALSQAEKLLSPTVNHMVYCHRILIWDKSNIKAMDDIGVVMTPFGDVVTVSLVANIYDFTK